MPTELITIETSEAEASAPCARLDLPAPDVTEAAAIAGLLSDRTRAGILAILRDGPHCVCEMAAALDIKQNNLSNHLARLREAGLETTALLLQGATVETLLKEASKLDIDMIVVGSHGRGAMHQLLVGSVSEGVIHASECPVLVVPTHNRT